MQNISLNNQIDEALDKIRGYLSEKNSIHLTFKVREAATLAKIEPFYLRWSNQSVDDTAYKLYEKLFALPSQILNEIRNVVLLAKREDRKKLENFFERLANLKTLPKTTDSKPELDTNTPVVEKIKTAKDYYNDLVKNLDKINEFGSICTEITSLNLYTLIKLLILLGKSKKEIKALLKQRKETLAYRKEIKANEELTIEETEELLKKRVIQIRDKKFWIGFKRYFKKTFFDQTFKTRKKAYDNLETGEVYIGDAVFEHKQATKIFKDYIKNQKCYTEEVLKKKVLCFDGGDPVCTIYDLYTKKIGNEKNELINKAHGIQKLVIQNNYYSVLITVTLPSKNHSRTKKSDNVFYNENFAGTTITEGVEKLQKIFSNPNKEASRKKWTVFGLRALQPHHDGTGHMHIYLSGIEEHVKKMCKQLEKETRKIFGADFSEERSFDVVIEDPKKGSLNNYLLTYLLGNEKTRKGDANKYEEIKEWSQNLNIRRFAWFGLDGVTTTRLAKNEYIRRFRNGDLTQRDKEFFDFFEEEKGKLRFNYQKYIEETGGVGYNRKDNARLKIEKILEEKTGKYGENYTLVKGLSFFKNRDQHDIMFEKIYVVISSYDPIYGIGEEITLPPLNEEDTEVPYFFEDLTNEETITTQNNEVAKVSYSFPSCAPSADKKSIFTVVKDGIYDKFLIKNRKILKKSPKTKEETEFWKSSMLAFINFST